METKVKGEFSRPELIMLDVYETLLDMRDVEYRVNSLLDSKRGYRIWFDLFMQNCFVDNITGQFHDFKTISTASMEMAARYLDEKLAPNSADEVLWLLRHLPLHEGVQKGLSSLYDEGFRLAALTNVPADIVSERMDRTGLISYFEQVLSAEEVKKYKPAAEVYQWAAKKAGLPPGSILLVTSHGWDIAGAAAAGMQTAFVKTPDAVVYPLAPQPQFMVNDLTQLCSELHSLYAVPGSAQ